MMWIWMKGEQPTTTKNQLDSVENGLNLIFMRVKKKRVKWK